MACEVLDAIRREARVHQREDHTRFSSVDLNFDVEEELLSARLRVWRLADDRDVANIRDAKGARPVAPRERLGGVIGTVEARVEQADREETAGASFHCVRLAPMEWRIVAWKEHLSVGGGSMLLVCDRVPWQSVAQQHARRDGEHLGAAEYARARVDR